MKNSIEYLNSARGILYSHPDLGPEFVYKVTTITRYGPVGYSFSLLHIPTQLQVDWQDDYYSCRVQLKDTIYMRVQQAFGLIEERLNEK